MAANPAKLAGANPKTPRRAIRPYTRAELDAIALELSPAYRPLPQFASATGLRPEEWLVLERSDIDRRNGVANVRRTLSDGEVVELDAVGDVRERDRQRREPEFRSSHAASISLRIASPERSSFGMKPRPLRRTRPPKSEDCRLDVVITSGLAREPLGYVEAAHVR